MKVLLIIILSIASTHVYATCVIPREDVKCYEVEEGVGTPVSNEDCETYSDRCVLYNDECVACDSGATVAPGTSDEDLKKQFYPQTAKIIDEAKLIDFRSLTGIPFLPNLPGHCLPPTTFPGNCKPTRNEPYVLEPPIEVPYCLRIPCDPSDNSLYDRSHRDCGMQPGCYFDKALSEYREAFGPSVLPGVPVCHLAIRSKTFRDKAQAVINQFGAWNPYFTNCLLNTFDEEIRKGPAGCDLIPVVEVFHVIPKMAGWGTITTYECSLIDACYLQGRGCFYPVDISNVRVKSGQKYFPRIGATKYGRPKCQAFDNSSPINTLKSYHRCLSAGCTVDDSITSLYHSHLFSLGQHLTASNHWDYWKDVGRGIVGPHNVADVLGQYGYTGQQAPVRTTPGPTTTANPFDSIFTMPRLRRSLGLFGQPQGVQNCGPHTVSYGGRPCPPSPPLSPFFKKEHCPYKPFFVPRFPVLTGSFEGCCDVNLCYLPKKEISKMHYSGPSHYYTEWSAWSGCSVSCGVGVQERYRKCVSRDQSLCTGEVKEQKPCRERACCTWGKWGRWSPCPVSCFPGGIQSRKRVPSVPHCTGAHEQVRSCNNQSCDGHDYGTWGNWVDVGCVYRSFTCERTRQRYCRNAQGGFSTCKGTAYVTSTERCDKC